MATPEHRRGRTDHVGWRNRPGLGVTVRPRSRCDPVSGDLPHPGGPCRPFGRRFRSLVGL
eukprot:4886913-Prymnesium_polylepis.1